MKSSCMTGSCRAYYSNPNSAWEMILGTKYCAVDRSGNLPHSLKGHGGVAALEMDHPTELSIGIGAKTLGR